LSFGLWHIHAGDGHLFGTDLICITKTTTMPRVGTILAQICITKTTTMPWGGKRFSCQRQRKDDDEELDRAFMRKQSSENHLHQERRVAMVAGGQLSKKGNWTKMQV